jgi:hypothetical protein
LDRPVSQTQPTHRRASAGLIAGRIEDGVAQSGAASSIWVLIDILKSHDVSGSRIRRLVPGRRAIGSLDITKKPERLSLLIVSTGKPDRRTVMKSSAALAVALLSIPAVALAQTGTKAPAPAPGQSEYAPGQRAKGPGDAKDFAPGQRMHKKDVKSQPGASEYAPGNLPNKDVKK